MLGWFRNRNNLRFTKDKPPEHSRCDLCYHDFHFPCRTNCGHWLCGTCVLRHSILLMDDFRKFKCPTVMCESQVYNLVPHSPVLTQPGRGVAEVLGEILQFNREHKKEVDLLQTLRGMPDFMFDNLHSVYTLIQYADTVYDFRLWPNEGIEFRLVQMLRCALLVSGTVFMYRRRIREYLRHLTG